MIFIIEDDFTFATCLKKYCGKQEVMLFSNVIDAINNLDSHFPDLIFLDILLTGPDGFTFLNELASYPDTSKIPIVIISSINFKGKDLSDYGVVGALNKETLLPKEVQNYVKRYSH